MLQISRLFDICSFRRYKETFHIKIPPCVQSSLHSSLQPPPHTTSSTTLNLPSIVFLAMVSEFFNKR